MSNTNMDDIFKDYGSFEREPKNDRWSAISAELDKDKKRRVLWWWFIGGAAASLIGIAMFILFTPISSTEESQIVNSENTAITENSNSSETPYYNDTTGDFEKMASKIGDYSPQTETSKGQKGNENKYLLQNTKVHSESHSNEESKAMENLLSSENGNYNLKEINQPNHKIQIATLPSASLKLKSNDWWQDKLLSNSENGPYSCWHRDNRAQTKPTKEEDNKNKEDDFKPSWDIGISFSSAYSTFSASKPRNFGSAMGNITPELLSENTELHKQINKGGYSVSQGISVAFRFHKNWTIGTGIGLHQTTQILKFNLESVTDDPLNAPQDMPEGGYTSNSNYQLPFQKLSRGTENTVNNKYFGREIPLFLNFNKKLNEKFELLVSCGITYRWVSSGSLFLPDIDNVGILSLNSPEDYPGIRSTWHSQASFGLAYTLKNGFSLQVQPQCRFGLRSNIRFDRFVQQKQQEFGLQIRLVKNIRFQ